MNDRDWPIIAQRLQNAISHTVKQFQEYPSDFLSESDIQSVLFGELRNEMRHSDLRMKYEAGCDKEGCFGTPFSISRVMSEFWFEGDGPCDVVILCREQDGQAALWRQPCRIGIEIKLWQPREYHNWHQPGAPQKDVEKLQRYWNKRNEMGGEFTGIAMLFRHPNAFAGPEVDKIVGNATESAFPENGISVHVVGKEWHWKCLLPTLELAAACARSVG